MRTKEYIDEFISECYVSIESVNVRVSDNQSRSLNKCRMLPVTCPLKRFIKPFGEAWEEDFLNGSCFWQVIIKQVDNLLEG